MRFQSLRLLDEVLRLPQLEAFDARRFLDGVAEELARLAGGAALDDVGAQLDALGGLLPEIDRFAQRSMGIRLSWALASTPAPPQLHKLLSATVVSYEGNLPLLRQRVADAIARLNPAAADDVTRDVMGAAERALGGRAALRAGVLALAQQTAQARLPSVEHTARDRSLEDAERLRWRRARVDLEQIAARPETLAAGSFAERLAKITPPDDPEPEPQGSRFSLLEID
jgi:hypothetical protein